MTKGLKFKLLWYKNDWIKIVVLLSATIKIYWHDYVQFNEDNVCCQAFDSRSGFCFYFMIVTESNFVNWGGGCFKNNNNKQHHSPGCQTPWVSGSLLAAGVMASQPWPGSGLSLCPWPWTCSSSRPCADGFRCSTVSSRPFQGLF